MLTTDDLQSLARDRIDELRAEGARERLGRGFGGARTADHGVRGAIGRAFIAFGLIVEGAGGAPEERAA